MDILNKYKNAPEIKEMMFLLQISEIIAQEPKYALARATFSPIPDSLAKAKGCYGKLGYCTLEMLLKWFNHPLNSEVHACDGNDLIGTLEWRVRVTGHQLTGTSSSLWFCPKCGRFRTSRGIDFKMLRDSFFEACEQSRKDIPEGCEVMSVGEVVNELKQKILGDKNA